VFAVPVLWLAVISVVAGLLGLAAAVIPAWRASRMNVLEAIGTE
jgi:ABC-type antimicrobial peptide transport system permease subunit